MSRFEDSERLSEFEGNEFNYSMPPVSAETQSDDERLSEAAASQFDLRFTSSAQDTVVVSQRFWNSYSKQFVREVIMGLIIGLVCNGIWGIPLYQVVDVNLAISISFLVVIFVMLFFVFLMEISQGQWWDALDTTIVILTSAFLPFGAVLGYMIYGWLGGGDVTSASFVYKTYVGFFGSIYEQVAATTGDFLGWIVERKNEAGELVSQVNMTLVREWVPIIASAATILNFLREWFWSPSVRGAAV